MKHTRRVAQQRAIRLCVTDFPAAEKIVVCLPERFWRSVILISSVRSERRERRGWWRRSCNGFVVKKASGRRIMVMKSMMSDDMDLSNIL
jgi:hypothetical protein